MYKKYQHQQPSQPPLSHQHWNGSSFSPRNCLTQQQLTLLPEAPAVLPLRAKLMSCAPCLTVKKHWHSGANTMRHIRCWRHSQRISYFRQHHRHTLNVFSVSVGGWQQNVATASPRTWRRNGFFVRMNQGLL